MTRQRGVTWAVMAVVGLGLVAVAPSADAARTRGIVGQAAPALGVSTWFNLPEGKTSVDVGDYRGQVLVMLFFQSWCPGCHKRGFPSIQALTRQFAGRKDVGFLVVQTVFEGGWVNTAQRAKESADRYGLTVPVGHVAGKGDRSPPIMRRYRSGGTPWIVVVDKKGVVRFDGFHLPAAKAGPLIERLAAQATPAR